MKYYLIFVFALFLQSKSYGQSFGRVAGRVKDAEGKPLAGTTISLISLHLSTVSDEQGLFEFNRVPSGRIFIRSSFVGYSTSRKEIIVKRDSLTSIDVMMTTSAVIGEEVIVTSSRHPERISGSPASISVISSKELQQSASPSPMDLFSTVLGLEFVRSGVDVININARGFNNAFNAKILQLTDGRNSMFAGSAGLMSGKMNTVIKEDIDQMEIVLGPSAAIYGPNAHNGVLNTITKDPRVYQGTTIVLSGGNQEMMSARFRQATKINDRWAFKLTGEYTTGKDFNFKDSVFAGGGVYGPAVTIAEKIKTYQFLHARGEAHLLYTVNPGAYVELAYGVSSNNYIDVSNSTRNQGQDWRFSFLQAKYVSPHITAQVYNTWTSAGQTYGLSSYTRDFYNRTHSTITDPTNPAFPSSGYLQPEAAEAYATRLGNMFKEKSHRTNADVRYRYDFIGLGLNLQSGLNYQIDRPNTFGTILVDAGKRVEIDQFGGDVLVEKSLPFKLKLTAAARVDHHSLFGNLFSPKFALIRQALGGSFRITWGQAYAAPIILFQRANVLGLIFGNGSGIGFIPNGSSANDPNAVKYTTALRPEEIKTWETGYRGHLTTNLYLDANAYYGVSKNFISPAISISGRPLNVGEVTLDPSKLLVPGTVDATGILNNASFSSYFNYGRVASYGADVGIFYFPVKRLSFNLKYSWFSSDITKDDLRNDANKDGYVSLDEKSLNAPKNRISAGIGLSNLANGKLFLNLSARWVQQYDFYSGSQIGTAAGKGKRGVVYGGINPLTGMDRNYLKNFNWGALGGFTTFDLSAGYKFSEMLNLNASVSNLFDTRQIEFVASPSIGRLISLELRVNLPAASSRGSANHNK